MNAKIDRLKASEEEGLKRLLEVRRQQEARKKKENLDQWEDKIYGSTEATSNEIKEIKKKKKKKKRKLEEVQQEVEESVVVEEKPKKKKTKKVKPEVEPEETVEQSEESLQVNATVEE